MEGISGGVEVCSSEGVEVRQRWCKQRGGRG